MIMGKPKTGPSLIFYNLLSQSCLLQNIIKDVIPDVYVHRIMIGGNLIVDTESGFFRDTNRQVIISLEKVIRVIIYH